MASSVVGTLTSTHVSSSAAMAKSSMENPAPPYSTGMNGEAGVGHFAVGLPAGQERLPAVGRAVDLTGDRTEHALGEGLGVLLQLLLAVAQGEIDGHDRHLLPVSRFLSHVQ